MIDPIATLLAWRDEAAKLGVNEPDAAALATATPEGRPSVRMVLIRGVVQDNLHFFTNYQSRKAGELDTNPFGALCLHWDVLKRQIRAEGPVTRLPAEASDAYFARRPRGHQLSAWASPQSRPILSLEEVAAKAVELDARFDGAPVPRPEFWGGYSLRVERIELWQGRPDRLHERRLFVRDGVSWREQLLGP